MDESINIITYISFAGRIVGVGDGRGGVGGGGGLSAAKGIYSWHPISLLTLATNAYRHAHSSHPHPHRVNIFVLTGAKTDCGEKR